METKQNKIINFVYKAPVALCFFVVSLYAIYVFLDFKNDSLDLLNSVFAVFLSLAAVSFSFARVKEAESISNRLCFAGERLLQGSILIIVTSALKYALVKANVFVPIESANYLIKITFWFVALLSSVVFINAMLFAHTGIRVLNDLLIQRMTREKDWDDAF